MESDTPSSQSGPPRPQQPPHNTGVDRDSGTASSAVQPHRAASPGDDSQDEGRRTPQYRDYGLNSRSPMDTVSGRRPEGSLAPSSRYGGHSATPSLATLAPTIGTIGSETNLLAATAPLGRVSRAISLASKASETSLIEPDDFFSEDIWRGHRTISLRPSFATLSDDQAQQHQGLGLGAPLSPIQSAADSKEEEAAQASPTIDAVVSNDAAPKKTRPRRLTKRPSQRPPLPRIKDKGNEPEPEVGETSQDSAVKETRSTKPAPQKVEDKKKAGKISQYKKSFLTFFVRSAPSCERVAVSCEANSPAREYSHIQQSSIASSSCAPSSRR